MTQQNSPRTWITTLLGTILVAVYTYVLILSFDFRLDDPDNQARPILLVLGLFTVAFLIYLAACIVVYRAFPEGSRRIEEPGRFKSRNGWAPLFWIFLFGTVFRVLMVFSYPIQEIDIYRYIVDGSTVLAGFDPYVTPPQKIDTVRKRIENSERPNSPPHSIPNSTERNELRIARMVDARPGLLKALSYVHFKEYTTPYPPVSQAVFAMAVNVVPTGASLNRYVLAMKFTVVLFDLATAILIVLLLRHLSLPTPWVIAYCWCPLLVKEFANSGHLDSIVVFIMTAAILATVFGLWPDGRTCDTRAPEPDASDDRNKRLKPGWILLSSVLLALAVGAKIFPVILFPLWSLACLKRGGWLAGLIGSAAFCLVTLVLLWPMARHLNVTKTIGHRIVPEVIAAPEPNSIDSGIEAFAKYWEMNDLMFMVVVENLKPDELLQANQIPAWFVVIPDRIRKSVTDQWVERSQVPRAYVAFWLTRRLMAGVFVFAALIYCLQFWRNPMPVIWLEMVFLTTAWFWLLSPTQNPWYWTWSLPMLVFARGRTWFLVSGVVMAYYLRFYFDYHFTDTLVWGTGLPGTRFFDFILPWVEFLPVLLLLVVGWCVRTMRGPVKLD